MTTATAARVEALLTGVRLPASRTDLLAYARLEQATAEELGALDRLPDGEYGSLDDVVEALAPVQPPGDKPTAEVPHAESGDPPGRDAYTA